MQIYNNISELIQHDKKNNKPIELNNLIGKIAKKNNIGWYIMTWGGKKSMVWGETDFEVQNTGGGGIFLDSVHDTLTRQILCYIIYIMSNYKLLY